MPMDFSSKFYMDNNKWTWCFELFEDKNKLYQLINWREEIAYSGSIPFHAFFLFLKTSLIIYMFIMDFGHFSSPVITLSHSPPSSMETLLLPHNSSSFFSVYIHLFICCFVLLGTKYRKMHCVNLHHCLTPCSTGPIFFPIKGFWAWELSTWR